MVRWVWDQIENLFELVGLVVFYTSLVSRSIEKRELKGAYILLKPSENVQQACDVGLPRRAAISTADKTEQNPQKIRYGAMRKVMIGFVFPIRK